MLVKVYDCDQLGPLKRARMFSNMIMFDYRTNRKKSNRSGSIEFDCFLGSGSLFVFGLGFVRLTTLGLYKEASEKRGLKTGISALLSKRY